MSILSPLDTSNFTSEQISGSSPTGSPTQTLAIIPSSPSTSSSPSLVDRVSDFQATSSQSSSQVSPSSAHDLATIDSAIHEKKFGDARALCLKAIKQWENGGGKQSFPYPFFIRLFLLNIERGKELGDYTDAAKTLNALRREDPDLINHRTGVKGILGCDGSPLLHHFAQAGNEAAVGLLLAYGASTTVDNDQGLDPSTVAMESGHPGLTLWLETVSSHNQLLYDSRETVQRG